MRNKLTSSIYIEPTDGAAQNAHALAADITTRQGFDLQIAAVSQKKPGQYTQIDTPRKTLLSFVTSLQSGGDNSIEQLIHRAVGLVTISTGGYIRRRGGAPCGLAAAILLENRLYTIQIGAGEILHQHGDHFNLITPQSNMTAPWLGESRNFSLETINFQKTDLLSSSTILVCQAGFLQTAKNDYKSFKQAVSEYSNRPEDLAQELAVWAANNGVGSGLTMAAHVVEVQAAKPEQPSEPSAESEADDLGVQSLPSVATDKIDQQKAKFTIEPIVEEPHRPKREPRVRFEADPRLSEPIRPEEAILPIKTTSAGYDGAELNLGDKVVSKVLFDSLTKGSNASNKIDTAPAIPVINPVGDSETSSNSTVVNDTVRTTAVDISPAAPIRTNGIVEHHSVPMEMAAVLDEPAVAESVDTPDEQPQPTAKIGRFYRLMTISSIGLFLAMIGLGVVVVLQRGFFADVAAQEGVNSSPDVSAASLDAETALEPAVAGQEVGLLSQGASAETISVYSDQELGARGLIHFAINNNNENGASERNRNIFAWAGSRINFENTSPGTQFGVEEQSTIFIDSTRGTVRPELTELFGVAESSAGCMSINYRSTDDPLIISCYAGTCRWLGPLNRNYEIPAGQRLELDSNLRSENPATFEPLYFTETTVFARTLGGVPAGKEIAGQCLDPFLAEGAQLTEEQSTAIAGAMALNIAQEVGWWRVGNSPHLHELQKGDTVNIRGLTRFTLAVSVAEEDGSEAVKEHEVYAWPGSGLHFNPELDENQFDVGEGSALFLNSTESVIRPFFPALFGTAESADGCMAITFPSAEKPLALSCYSGTCAWKGALNRNYTIPVGQRLELASNPRVEEPAKLQPIYRTETAVVARTLGSIPAGLEISNRCVEPYLINPESVVIVPLATSTLDPSPTPLPTATPEPTVEESDVETVDDGVVAAPTLPPLETPDGTDEAESAEETPEAEVESTPDTLSGS